jgi:hypothetical protein
MTDSAIERQEVARAEVEGARGGTYLNVPGQNLDGEPAIGVVFRHPRRGLERREHHAQVVVFDQCLGVVTDRSST